MAFVIFRKCYRLRTLYIDWYFGTYWSDKRLHAVIHFNVLFTEDYCLFYTTLL